MTSESLPSEWEGQDGGFPTAEASIPQKVGEVIQATSTTFVAQCYQLYGSPPLGALVRTGNSAVYGTVFQVITEPLDPGRPVLARGESSDTEEEIYRNNPQLEHLLTSRFETLVLGHRLNGHSHQKLPPLPPRVHSFVYVCEPAEVAEFTVELDFLRLILQSGVSVADEVLSACLREASLAQPDREAFLYRSGKALAVELATDLFRLNAILRRLHD